MAFSFMNLAKDMCGIVTSVLINKFGIRFVMLLGGAIHAIGLLATSFAPDARWFCVSIGPLYGMGLNMVQLSSTLIIPQYFDKVILQFYMTTWQTT